MNDMAERLKSIVVEHLGVDEALVTEDAGFIDDLGADSLDAVQLIIAFEETFCCPITDPAAERIITVGDAIRFIETEREKKLEIRPLDQREPADAGASSSPPGVYGMVG